MLYTDSSYIKLVIMYPVDFAVILDGYIISVYMFYHIFIQIMTYVLGKNKMFTHFIWDVLANSLCFQNSQHETIAVTLYVCFPLHLLSQFI